MRNHKITKYLSLKWLTSETTNSTQILFLHNQVMTKSVKVWTVTETHPKEVVKALEMKKGAHMAATAMEANSRRSTSTLVKKIRWKFKAMKSPQPKPSLHGHL